MELRHLRYFVAVAEDLSFTHAAKRLHIGQPPLSQAIKALEEDIGAQLFERSRRWVRLTEAGTLFLHDARQILSLATTAAQSARRAQNGEIGELNIGFNSSTPFTSTFANTINAYRSQFPRVTLHFFELPTMQQIDAIRARKIDLGFVRPPETKIPRDMHLIKLLSSPLVVICPSNHRLAGTPSVVMKDLVHEHFVMFLKSEGTTIYPQIHRLCKNAGFIPKIALEVREAGTIIGLVAAGCGIAILPELFTCIDIKNISHSLLLDADASTDLMVAYRKRDISPLIKSFINTATAR